jgi:hypothetical protein
MSDSSLAFVIAVSLLLVCPAGAFSVVAMVLYWRGMDSFGQRSTEYEARHWKAEAMQAEGDCERRIEGMREQFETEMNVLLRQLGKLIMRVTDLEEMLGEESNHKPSPRAMLRELMYEKLGRTEFDELLFDMGIERGKLEGENLAEWIISLIKYCKRHQRLDELLKQLKRMFPSTAWPVSSV